METREEFPEQVIENMDILYTVYPQYIDRVFEVIKEDYGSIERFIRKALYLTPKTVENLREKYLI
jgi:protein-tyrosine phosphatase